MRTRADAAGLVHLRRSGAVTELLFLYECTTLEPTQLQPIADRLGVTVQAVSHSYGQLSRRGLVELRDGHYRPTMPGVAWLHEALGRLKDDVHARLDRLHVVRSTRAVALQVLRAGEAVSLEMRGGLLSARRGSGGPSRGITRTAGSRGALVEVAELEGILPIAPAPIVVRTLSESDLLDPALGRRLRAAVEKGTPGLLGAQGLEAYLALRSATERPILRFAVGAACLEAARIGVACTVVVLNAELPRLLSEFAGLDPPALDVLPLGRVDARSRRKGPRRSSRRT